jgi:hypothetical protein
MAPAPFRSNRLYPIEKSLLRRSVTAQRVTVRAKSIDSPCSRSSSQAVPARELAHFLRREKLVGIVRAARHEPHAFGQRHAEPGRASSCD